MKIATLFFIAIVSISSYGFTQTVTIGTQTWTTKNLDVATFRNGEIIPEAKTDEEWQAAGRNQQAAWCYYKNSSEYGTKYGKLYNWHAVNDARGLAPTGYHIPTNEEWTVLSTFLGDDVAGVAGGPGDAGDKMKMQPVFRTNISYVDQGGYYAQNWVACSNCKNWNSEYRKKVPCHVCKDERGKSVQGNYIPKTKKKVETKEEIGWNGNNSSGFSGLPGGYRKGSMNYLEDYYYENFSSVGNDGYWWSATQSDISSTWYRKLSANLSFLYRFNDNFKGDGFSVRCVRD